MVNVKRRLYACVLETSKIAKIKTVNVIVEHIITMPMFCTNKFIVTVLIFAVYRCAINSITLKLCILH